MNPKPLCAALLAGWLNNAIGGEPLTLIFAGDIMLADGPSRVIAAGGDPLAPFASILAAADYRIGNLECAVATGGKAQASKVWSFRARPETLKILEGRFDAVSLANNHSGDYGQAAFVETTQHLDAAGIARFGGGGNLAEAHHPLWIAQKGLKIAILGYNEYKPRRFEAGPQTPGIAWSEDEQVITDIRAAKGAGADHVIPFMHWGWETSTQPDDRQRSFARRMIDEGASAVIGSHPHVTQGADIYHGKPIVYSLGNFVFDGFDYEDGRRGWLLRLHIDRDGIQHWETLAAHIDPDGTPYPMPGQATPCGSRGDVTVAQCINP
ncbi:CapA family protein [Dechloromonas sp. XY25]|uniref:CapA family protein n=1 Tax=Dechloromonas hankyongensis TaxID=2908002 RepID=A0ABS9K1L1_9RHOO|nr:CapA family protein [Dechloromonas hankyongensis]MCG2577062.1 CapA family protein [Dechloromonas hankyongensis]